MRWKTVGLALGLAAWALGVVLEAMGETFPVEHREPLTVRALSGKTGRPVAHLRLTMTAGYDGHDLEQRLWRVEGSTDERGELRMPRAIAELPFLQVRVKKGRLCQTASAFVTDRIRNEGLNAPNSCGFIRAQEEPRVLVLFVRGEEEAAAPPKQQRMPELEAQASPEASVDFAPGKDVFGGLELVPPTATSQNEIEVLALRDGTAQPDAHDPARVVAPEPSGTEGRDDAYDVMCQPGI